MPDITLYMSPGSCSRVPLITLEELGVAYTPQLVMLKKGAHKTPEFKKINPKGKVPALVVDGEVLTENIAILIHLNRLFPDGGVLPKPKALMQESQQIADLCFCSTTLHPIVTRIAMPQFFAAEEAKESVVQKGRGAIAEFFQLIEDRLTDQPFWYGDTYSAVDAYIYWVITRVQAAGYEAAEFTAYTDHKKRMETRASVQRALQVERTFL